jgi:hypothetical protein
MRTSTRIVGLIGGALAGVVAFAAVGLASALWVRAFGRPIAVLAAALLVLAVAAVLPLAAARRPLGGLVAGVVMLALASTSSVQIHSGGLEVLRADPSALLTQPGGWDGAVLVAAGAVVGPSLAGLLRRRRGRREPRAS